ncbi:hypothetical protein M9Y10_025557 [Tritrichomonas musculus]|uniref:Uncharacterized protein n=2 Tax=Tritrichomonas musculus TaxID=1915356 RepID=A0ABR2H960_9EUKA
MSSTSSQENISIISSIFPSLVFNDFTLSSDNNSGFCDKFRLKDTTFLFGSYVVQIQNYLFEGIEIKFNLKGSHNNEIKMKKAKIKISVLSDGNVAQNRKLNTCSDIFIKNLEIEFCKGDINLFNFNSSDATISFREQENIHIILPSCEVICKENKIINSSSLQISLDSGKSLFEISSDDAHFTFPIKTSQFLFPIFYSIVNNLQSVNFTFKKADFYINKDTLAKVNNFSLKIGQNGAFSLTSESCELNLSSYNFVLHHFTLTEKIITIQDIDIKNMSCSICSISKGSDPTAKQIAPIINGSFENSNKPSLKIDVMPFEANFTLSRFQDLSNSFLSNSFVHHLLHLPRIKAFTIEFREILLNIKIEDNYILHIKFNFSYSNQADLILISSTKLSYYFNNNQPITKDQIFQYHQKKSGRSNGNITTSIVLSPLVYNFSIDEIIPFFKFVKEMIPSIVKVFLKGTVKVDIKGIQFFLGQTIAGSNEHSQMINLLFKTQPITIEIVPDGYLINTPVSFSMTYFNTLTEFWDTIIEPFNFQMVLKLNKFKRHVMFSVDDEISINLTSRFLSSLLHILKNHSIQKMPIAFVSNYTDASIMISLYEFRGQMTLAPMSSQPLLSDLFYVVLNDKKPIKFSVSAITSRTFIKNNIFIDIELKDGIKNIYFMNIFSIENKLGIDLHVLYKVKRSFTTLMNIKHKEKRGIPASVIYTMSFAAIPLTSANANMNCQSSTAGNVLNINEKHEQGPAFSPKKYKSIAYTIRGVDSDRDAESLVYLKKDQSDKTKVMYFYPRYEVENRLPFSVAFSCKHMKAVSTVIVESLKKKSLLMPFDVNQEFELTVKIEGKEVSRPAVINLKIEPSKPLEYDLSFEKCRLKLTVSIGDTIPIVHFIIRCPTTIFNHSSSSFLINRVLLQKAKSYTLPLFESDSSPALLIDDYQEPQIEIPATSNQMTIHFLRPPFLERNEVFMLKMKVNEKLFTPLKVHVKRDLIRGNLIYLHDFVHVKNGTKRPIYFILGNEPQQIRLKFEPGVTSPILITNENKSFNIEIDGYKRSAPVFLSYPIDTVLRFVRFDKLNRRKREPEIHIRMVITEKAEGENVVELTDATYESSPYLIVNNTDHILYAQQTNDWLPLIVQPRSSSIFAFDDPFQKPTIALTIEGKSVICHFSKDYYKTHFSFRVANETLRLNLKTNDRNQRVICITDQHEVTVYDHFITVTASKIRVTLITSFQTQLLSLFVNQIQAIGKTEHGVFNLQGSIKGIQIDDETECLPQGVILNGSMNKPDSTFLSFQVITSSTSKFVDLSQLIAVSISLSPIDIQINSEFFLCFRKFLIDSTITDFKFIQKIFNNVSVNASVFVISPISISFFFRKNINDNQNGNYNLLHILPIQIPSLVNFTLPSILINNISCKFEALHGLITHIYSELLVKFACFATGHPASTQVFNYPCSFFEKITLSLTELNSSSKMETFLSKEKIINEMTENEFDILASQKHQNCLDNENADNQIVFIEVGKYNDKTSDDNKNKNINISLSENANNNSNESSNNNVSDSSHGIQLKDKDSGQNSSNISLSSPQYSSGNYVSPLLALFASPSFTVPNRDDFQFIKDENQINSIYNAKNLKKSDKHKLFQLKRIQPINLALYNNAVAITKRKKCPFYFAPLATNNQFLMIFDDGIDVVDKEQVNFVIPFNSIQEFSNEKNVVKVTIQPEKPKHSPKVIELSFRSPFMAETSMNEMISHLMMQPNK